MFSKAVRTRVEKVNNDTYRVIQESGSKEIDKSRKSIELKKVQRGGSDSWQVVVDGSPCQWFWSSPQELAEANVVI